MKANVENPQNDDYSPLVISIYVNILNRITQSKNDQDLLGVMKYAFIEYPATFNSIFDYGFGANHMWVSYKESGKRLILVEF